MLISQVCEAQNLTRISIVSRPLFQTVVLSTFGTLPFNRYMLDTFLYTQISIRYSISSENDQQPKSGMSLESRPAIDTKRRITCVGAKYERSLHSRKLMLTA